MKTWKTTLAVTRLLSVTLCSIASSITLAELPQYQTKDIGTLGGVRSKALATNDHGWVAGWAETLTGDRHAVLYRDGVLADLGTLGGLSSTATDLNDQGDVTGSADTADGNYHAFLYRDGEMIDLGTLGGPTSHGVAINESGHVIGYADNADGGYHAFLYSDGQMIDLGTLDGTMSWAQAINNAGEVTGWAALEDGSVHAFLYSAGVMHDIGTLGGTYSSGNAINERGEVTGEAQRPESLAYGHAFLFSDGRMLDIGQDPPYPYTTSSFGAAVNDSGAVAATYHDFGFGDGGCEERCIAYVYQGGVQTTPQLNNYSGSRDINNSGITTGAVGGDPWFDTRAFVYRPGDSTVVFSDLDWMSEIAPNYLQASMGVDLNDAGQLAGDAYVHFGGVGTRPHQRGFVATPVTMLFQTLAASVLELGPTKRLIKELELAHGYYEADDLQDTCSALESFNADVQRLPDKPVPQFRKDQLIGQSTEIMDAIGCP